MCQTPLLPLLEVNMEKNFLSCHQNEQEIPEKFPLLDPDDYLQKSERQIEPIFNLLIFLKKNNFVIRRNAKRQKGILVLRNSATRVTLFQK